MLDNADTYCIIQAYERQTRKEKNDDQTRATVDNQSNSPIR